MDTAVNVLLNAKTNILIIISELNAINDIKKISIKKLPLYIETINTLSSSIDYLNTIFVNDIPVEHKLKRLMILGLNINLQDFLKTLKECIEWYKNITGTKWYCGFLCYKLKDVILHPPSNLINQLNDTFDEISKTLPLIIDLEKNILGTAIRIIHPILQKSWINACGLNQLNDSELDANQIIQSLYLMLKIEENGNLKNDKLCRKMIVDYVNFIDTLAGTPPDGKITIQELNQIVVTPTNSNSVKCLLGICKQPNVEISKNDIQINFIGPVKINHTHTVDYPMPNVLSHCYGDGWPNKMVCEFIVPEFFGVITQEQKEFFGVEIESKLADQGWGGTGHDQLRYQVNDGLPIPGASVARDKFPEGIYKFTIPPDQVKLGDTVKIWLFCPPWNGWSMIMESIKAQSIFA